MRFMMLLTADNNTEVGILPTAQELETRGKYNEEPGQGRRAPGRRGPEAKLERGEGQVP